MVGEIIGVGIFLTPADMAKALGSPFWVLVVWLVVGAMALCGALCYGELAARYPEAGGGYVYLREAYGPGLAFLYGWKSLLVMDPGLTAALAVGIARYVAYLAPLSARRQRAVARRGDPGPRRSSTCSGCGAGARVLSRPDRRASSLLLGRRSCSAASLSGRRLSGPTSCRFVEPRPGSGSAAGRARRRRGRPRSSRSAAGGTSPSSAGEVRDPARTLPRALTLGVAVVTVGLHPDQRRVHLPGAPSRHVVQRRGLRGPGGRGALRPGGRADLRGGRGLRAGQPGRAISWRHRASTTRWRVTGCSSRAVADSPPALRHARARDRASRPAWPACWWPWARSTQIVAYFVFVTVAFVALTVAGLYRLPRPAPGALPRARLSRDAARFPGPARSLLLVLLGAGQPEAGRARDGRGRAGRAGLPFAGSRTGVAVAPSPGGDRWPGSRPFRSPRPTRRCRRARGAARALPEGVRDAGARRRRQQRASSPRTR